MLSPEANQECALTLDQGRTANCALLQTAVPPVESGIAAESLTPADGLPECHADVLDEPLGKLRTGNTN